MSKSASSSRAGARPPLAPLLGLLLILCLSGVAAGQAAPDPFGEHYRRAEALYEEGRYEECIAELRAAYAIKPLPRLLINMGNLQLKLNRPRQALLAYETYLNLEPKPSPQARAAVDAGMAQARTMLAEFERPAPPPARPPDLALTRPPPSGGAPEAAVRRRRPFYKAWWFWGSVGLLAAGAVAGIAVAAALPQPPPEYRDLDIHDVRFRSLR